MNTENYYFDYNDKKYGSYMGKPEEISYQVDAFRRKTGSIVSFEVFASSRDHAETLAANQLGPDWRVSAYKLG